MEYPQVYLFYNLIINYFKFMKKANYIWWLLGVVVVVLGVYLLVSWPTASVDDNKVPATNNSNNVTGDLTPADNTSGTLEGTPAAEEEVTRTPEPIEPEFMTAAEKSALNIGAGVKVQVLRRDAEGTITAYKVINNDSDILTSF